MSSSILGISAFYHDSAACLVRDGVVVAAAQEERFSRIKGDAAIPLRAVAYCLQEGNVRVSELAAVTFYEKPLLKFDRLIETYLSTAPRGFTQFRHSGTAWLVEKLFIERTIRRELGFQGQLLFPEHHESHAASAFYPSPFADAAILTIDGVGEWSTATIASGNGKDITMLAEMRWPDSLGLLYSAFTYYTGFKVNSGEYKVMGLAPYGEPKYVDLILRELLDLQEDGTFTLNQKYFNYQTGLTMTSEAFNELFGGPPREPESRLTQRDMDLARSIQDVTEEIVMRMARTAHRMTGQRALCLAGGVALNCVANGRLLREGPFEDIWIQPAAGDAGGALGAALLAWHRHFDKPRSAPANGDAMHGAYLGPGFAQAEIAEYLERSGIPHECHERSVLLARVAELLGEGKVIGWFDGRMEFGPRALGARSILGDPRSPSIQAQMNIRIKFREGFRPFAPSVLRHRVSDYFELDRDSPYMLLVAPVRDDRRLPLDNRTNELWGIDRLNVPRSDIPAVTHVDYSARIQTVTRETNRNYHDLIVEFERQTGCAVLVNTSFNVRGEPIVCTPEDAYQCFMQTDLDYLILYPYLLDKGAQPNRAEYVRRALPPLD